MMENRVLDIQELNGHDEQTVSLPPVEDAVTWCENPPDLLPVLIEGLFRQGAKMVLGGASKSRKSWILIQLALAIVNGMRFLEMQCTKVRVLLINMELMEAEMANRIKMVSNAMGCGREGLFVWNLRGHSKDLEILADSIIAQAREIQAELIILDPVYKVLGNRAENSNEAVAELLNIVDRVVEQTGAGFVFAHHFAKGAQGGKFVEDRISGAGAWWRDPDAGIFFTSLEEDDGFNVAMIARSFPPRDEFAVRANHPLMVVAEDLDPANIRQPGGRKKIGSAEVVADLILGKPMTRREWKEASGWSEGTFTRRVKEAEKAHLVVNKSGIWMHRKDTE